MYNYISIAVIFYSADSLSITNMKRIFSGTLEIQYLYNSSHAVSSLKQEIVKFLAQYLDEEEAHVQSSMDEEVCTCVRRAVMSDTSKPITITLPINLLVKNRASRVEKLSEKVWSTNGKLRICPEIWNKWITVPIQQGLTTIRQIVKEAKVNVQNVLLFGEISHITSARTALSREFTNIIIPADEEVAIVKGACLFGHHPEIIQSRVVKSAANFLIKEVSSK